METLKYIILLLLHTLQEPVLGKYVFELTNNNFQSIVSTKRMVLVNFCTHWCPYCRRLKREYEKAAKTLHEKFPYIPIAQVRTLFRTVGVKGCIFFMRAWGQRNSFYDNLERPNFFSKF